MRSIRLARLGAASLVAAFAGTARAADPAEVWSTLDAGRVRVHYPLGTEDVARRAAWAALDALDELTARLGWEVGGDGVGGGGPVEIVVRDDSDSANGAASVVPYARIELLARPPEPLSALADHEDWVAALVMHEMTHVVHLSVVGGAPAWINGALGRTLAPNTLSPPWLTEGLAVWEETGRTAGGRGRASVFAMYVRAEALGPGLPDLHEMSGDTRDWPGGFSRYVYGGRFVTWLARERGEAGLAAFAREYGGRLIPFALNRTADLAFDADLVSLWDDWRAFERREAAALVGERVRQGLTRAERLTRHGYEARGLRVSADRRWALYVRSGGDVVSSLWRVPLDRAGRPAGPGERLVRVSSSAGASWDPTDGTVVYTRRGPWREWRRWDDLVRLDPRTGGQTPLTRGLRARDPDVAADGRIAFVVSEPDRSRLAVGDRDLKAWRTVDVPGVLEVDGPRWSPDGRSIAVSGWRPGGERDLYVVDVAVAGPDAGGRGAPDAVRRLTRDRALDIDPCWSEDGGAIWFASDREGVFDLFVHDLSAGVVRRATRVATGAFDPAPAGDAVLYVGYSSEGFDLHRIPAPAAAGSRPGWAALPPAPPGDGPPRPAAAVSLAPAVPPGASPGAAPGPTVSASRYEPGATLLPRAWMPVVGAAGGVRTYGALVAGQDPVGRHRYVLRAAGGGVLPHLEVSADYAYDRLYPTLLATLSRTVRDRGDAIVAGGGAGSPYADEQWAVSGGLTLPFSGPFHDHTLSLRWSLEYLRAVTDRADVEHDPWGTTPRYPRDGLLSGLRLGWSYLDSERPVQAVGNEDGRLLNLSLLLRSKALFSEEEAAVLTWSAQTWAPVPWAAGRHHAVSLRYSGGLGAGGPFVRRAFVLGGPPEQDVFTSVLDQTFVGGGHLRGYPTGATRGDQEHLLTGEYRLPLASFLRGLLTIPLYLDRLTAAAFADYGAAMGPELDPGALRLGLGGELRLSLTLSYFLPAAFRLGLARGVQEGGELQGYLLAGAVY